MKEIRRSYMVVYGSDLVQDIRDKCSGDYEKAMVALVAPRARWHITHGNYCSSLNVL
jgi:hypothetical protein